jgi:hypothetical protein
MRQGYIHPFLIGLIILAVTAIALFAWQYNLEASVRKGTDIEACQATVDAASTAAIGNLVTIQCPTQMIVIKDDGVYRNSIRSKTPEKYLATGTAARRLQALGNQNPTENDVLMEMAKYAIAQEMAICWRVWGEGNKDPFKTRTLYSGNRCVTCDVVHFDPSFVSKVGGVGFKDFGQYLKDTNMSSGMTYFNYLRPENEKFAARGITTYVSPLLAYTYQNIVGDEHTQGGRADSVNADDIYLYKDDIVLTYLQGTSDLLSRVFFTDKPKAAVYGWPVNLRPPCDVLY